MRVTNLYPFHRHQFGQWTIREIVTDEGFVFNCCEQYMMYHKAILFGDYDIAKRIYYEDNPSRQQELGRLVSNYDEDIWVKHRYDIVVRGNTIKFTQHKDLRDRLLDTGTQYLVEASPDDCVWGIGVGINDPDINIVDRWRGLNLLGKALMDVRYKMQGVFNAFPNQI